MENFDRENIDELLEIRQIINIFPLQNFAPYGIWPVGVFGNGLELEWSGINGMV